MSSFSLDSIDHALPLDTNVMPVPSGRQEFDAASELQERASIARAEGNYSLAIDLLTQAMEAGEPTIPLLTSRADSLLRLRRPGAALHDCNAALQLNPDSTKALKYRGICNAYLGNWVEANTDLASAQRIDFHEDLEPSCRVAAERAAAIEVSAREKRRADEDAAKAREAAELEQRKKERVFVDFGRQLQTKSGLQPTASILGKAKLIGVYFSAHWCPPCRQFTPMLAEMYSLLREEEHSYLPTLAANQHALEIIFASSDRDPKSFEEYFHSQPWTAIPFAERHTCQELGSKYSVSGIPALFILNGENGTIVDNDGRSTVMNARGDPKKLLKAWKLL